MGAELGAHFRSAGKADLPNCGDVMYRAFRDIAERHNFPPDFPHAEAAAGLLGMMIDDPLFEALVAEQDGRIVGSIFVSTRSPVGGVSVITVDPQFQNRSIGRRLMDEGMSLLRDRGHSRQQLIQAAYHNRSLCLYSRLGFVAADMLSNMAGPPIKADFPGRVVRTAVAADADDCNALCRQVHGFDRAGEVQSAIAISAAVVVESGGMITGYSTGIGFVGHGVGETNDDLKALICSAEAFAGPGILIPTGNGELFQWCLDNGLQLIQQMTLMDMAPTGPPNGVYWPSILC